MDEKKQKGDSRGYMSLSNMPDDVKAHLAQFIRHKTVTKGAILQRKGDTERWGYYVRKGLLRSYTIDSKGKEHTFMFAPEGWVIADVETLQSSEPTVLFIDAIEDSELEAFSEELHKEISKAGKLKVEVLFRRVAVLQRRVLMLMAATARERYDDFVKTYPQIVQRVPQRLIASYLGITPEALSKIRGEIAKG